jgi:hypothetical protein
VPFVKFGPLKAMTYSGEVRGEGELTKVLSVSSTHTLSQRSLKFACNRIYTIAVTHSLSTSLNPEPFY